jgi:hypothetical protein
MLDTEANDRAELERMIAERRLDEAWHEALARSA